MASVRIRIKQTKSELELCKKRMSEAFKDAGNPKAISAFMSVPLGTIKAFQGRGLMSPSFACQFAEHYKGKINKKFTREYLRPDLKEWHWQQVDKDIEA